MIEPLQTLHLSSPAVALQANALIFAWLQSRLLIGSFFRVLAYSGSCSFPLFFSVAEGIKSPVSDISMDFSPTPPTSRSRSASRPESQNSNSPQMSRRLEVDTIPHSASFENIQYFASQAQDSDDDDHSSHETDSPGCTVDKRQQFSDQQNSSKSSMEERRKGYEHFYGSEQVLHYPCKAAGDDHQRRCSEGLSGDQGRVQRRQHSASVTGGDLYYGRLVDERKREQMSMGMRRRDKTTGMALLVVQDS